MSCGVEAHQDHLWEGAGTDGGSDEPPAICRIGKQGNEPTKTNSKRQWQAAGVSVLKSGVVNGMPYTLYSDGSINHSQAAFRFDYRIAQSHRTKRLKIKCLEVPCAVKRLPRARHGRRSESVPPWNESHSNAAV